MENLYFTQSTFTSVSLWILEIIVGLYMLYTGRRKPTALYLSGYLLFVSFLWLGWAWRYSMLGVWGQKYFYITWLILLALFCLIQFAYRYHGGNLHPRESNIALVLVGILIIIAYLIFLRDFHKLGPVYEFESHSYTQKFPLTLLILLSLYVWAIGIFVRKTLLLADYSGVWSKLLAQPGSLFSPARLSYMLAKFFSGWVRFCFPGQKQASINRNYALLVFYALVMGMFYTLQKSGLISWEAYVISYNIVMIGNIFFFGLIFLNNSGLPSSFMVKTVGISIATFLVVITLIGHVTLGFRESAYNELRINEAGYIKRLLAQGEVKNLPVHIKYLLRKTGDPAKKNMQYTLVYGHKSDFKPAEFAEWDQKRYQTRLNFFTSALQRSARSMDLEKREKLALLKARADFTSESTRKYRMLANKRKYIHYNFQMGEIYYEVGYNYLDYRLFMHKTVSILLYILAGATASLLIIFPLFFRVSLITPLRELVQGVEKVNHGHLNVNVPVKLEDEIGFLTASFNEMVISIRNGKVELQAHADKLEDRVKDRTRVLSRTLDKVKSLKAKQDADYYLTSLLIKPLIRNENNSSHIKTEILLEQKRKFVFKKYRSQLGGDLCITANITLHNSSYMVFINADAMGKSMQGTGGALVLGASVQARLIKTRLRAQNNTPPELWLQDLYQELQEAFLSFDGSMLISAFMGLVHEESGFVYYINAEHPWTVRYRAGKAKFIDEELSIPKLGTPEININLQVHTLQMEPNDVLLAGSDGRDDIIMRTEERFNEDDKFFLRRVEESDADPEKILKATKKNHRLVDDFSLLRIQYNPGTPSIELSETQRTGLEQARALFKNENSAEALELMQEIFPEEPTTPPALHLLSRIHMQRKNYEQAKDTLQQLYKLEPADGAGILLLSNCLRILGRLDEALTLGKCLYLRDAKNLANLNHLTDIYIRLKEFDAATNTSEQALAITPEDPVALKLQAKLE